MQEVLEDYEATLHFRAYSVVDARIYRFKEIEPRLCTWINT